ncbi:MAG: RNA polymerase sigma factor [Verrucomicrobiota bacterium]
MNWRKQNERELRDRIQAGFRYAYSLTEHQQDAEDLVQQAWMKCQKRYGKVRNNAVFFTAIRNQFYDHLRRKKIVSFASVSASDEEALIDTGQPVAGSSDDIETILSQLRVEEREVIFLHIVEGRTAREIASITGSPRNTVLSQIHRARKKLADQWRETRDVKESIGDTSPSRTRNESL